MSLRCLHLNHSAIRLNRPVVTIEAEEASRLCLCLKCLITFGMRPLAFPPSHFFFYFLFFNLFCHGGKCKWLGEGHKISPFLNFRSLFRPHEAPSPFRRGQSYITEPDQLPFLGAWMWGEGKPRDLCLNPCQRQGQASRGSSIRTTVWLGPRWHYTLILAIGPRYNNFGLYTLATSVTWNHNGLNSRDLQLSDELRCLISIIDSQSLSFTTPPSYTPLRSRWPEIQTSHVRYQHRRLHLDLSRCPLLHKRAQDEEIVTQWDNGLPSVDRLDTRLLHTSPCHGQQCTHAQQWIWFQALELTTITIIFHKDSRS